MTPSKRIAALEAMADHLLAHGLEASTLRPLAKACGMSDRMLIYHFKDKDTLTAVILEVVQARFLALIASSLPPTALSPALLYDALLDRTEAPAFAPFMALFLELMTRSLRGDTVARRHGGALADRLVTELAKALPPGPAQMPQAMGVMCALDGALLLRAVGREGYARQGRQALAP